MVSSQEREHNHFPCTLSNKAPPLLVEVVFALFAENKSANLVIAPVELFFEIDSNPFSERTGPLNDVFAIINPPSFSNVISRPSTIRVYVLI